MATSFRFNGFTITVLTDKVIASQAGIKFTFKSIESAMEALAW
jgi:hypothetical protein